MTEAIPDLPHFMAHAHAMEVEAADRYRLFAVQMDVHNNTDIADLFARLADIEAKHADEILARAGTDGLPDIALGNFGWIDPEAPETAPVETVHYMMSAHHVLTAALEGECRALAFYESVAATTASAEIRRMAEEFADEERDHVALVTDMLQRYPAPEADWADDMDPPQALE